VDVSKEDFPELAKKIRGGACRDVIGKRIVVMRHAKSGGLLIEVHGNPEEVSAVRVEISRSAGAEIGVSTLQQRELLEIRDLDQWSDGPEVLEAITLATGCNPGALRLVSMRKRFGGAQLALVSASMEVSPMSSLKRLVASGPASKNKVDRDHLFRILQPPTGRRNLNL